MMKLVIERDRWLRGNDFSSLLHDGKMCCLGFLAKACGATDDDIEGRTEPLDAPLVPWPEAIKPDIEPGCFSENSELTERLIQCNDEHAGVDFEPEREKNITELMAKVGVEVTFVDTAKVEV